jgi:hypothetical protein
MIAITPTSTACVILGSQEFACESLVAIWRFLNQLLYKLRFVVLHGHLHAPAALYPKKDFPEPIA